MHPVRHSSLGFRKGRGVGPFPYNLDTHNTAGKSAGTVVCPTCRAVYSAGRWDWRPAPAGAASSACPACVMRNRGQFAHVIAIAGSYRQHRHEILARIRNTARAEMADHPLERLWPLRMQPDRLEFAASGMHVVRRVLAALAMTFHRHVELRRGDLVTEVLFRSTASSSQPPHGRSRSRGS